MKPANSLFGDQLRLIPPNCRFTLILILFLSILGSEVFSQTLVFSTNQGISVADGGSFYYCLTDPIDLIYNNTPGNKVFAGPGITDLGTSSPATANFNPAAAGVGTHSVTYFSKTWYFVVSNTPAVTFGAVPNQCQNNTTGIDLHAYTDPDGGVFSGAGVAGNVFTPSLAGAGTHVITYTYPATGCRTTVAQSIVVNAISTASLADFAPVCQGTAAFVLTQGTPIGGTYSGTGVAGGMFNPAVAGVGTHAITYTITSGVCVSSATKSITINALPAVTFTGLNYIDPNPTPPRWYCDNDPVDIDLTGSPAGGSFSGPGITNTAPGFASFNPDATSLGLQNITYTYTDGNGCTNSQTLTTRVGTMIYINGLDAQHCKNDGIDAFSVTPHNPAFSVVSGNGVSDFNNGNAEFNPANAAVVIGNNTITYTYSDVSGCVNVVTKDVAIGAVPVADFTGLNAGLAYCVDAANVTLTGNYAPAGTFSGPGITDLGNGTATFSPSSLVAGSTYNITYSYTTGMGCSDSEVKTVTIHALPTAFAVTGGGTYCEGGAGEEIGLSNSGNNVNYQLYRNGISLNPAGLVAGTGSDITFGNQVQDGIYTVVATGALTGCSQTMTGSATVLIDPLPLAAQPITGLNVVCQGSTQTYSVPIIANATSYMWSLPVGASISAGAGTNSITIVFSTVAVSGILRVYGKNDCGVGTEATKAITVNPLPAAAGAITGASNVCAGSTYTYNIGPIANATGYTWVVPAGATINSGQGTISISVNYSFAAVSGNITVIGTNACGSGTLSTYAIDVNSRPTVNLTVNGASSVCNGQSATLQMSFTGTGPWNYTYSDGTASTSGSTSLNPFTFNVSPSSTMTYTVTALSDLKCTAIAADITGSVLVTVKPRPTSNMSGSATVCSGTSVPINISLTGTGPWNLVYSDGTAVNVNTAITPYVFNVNPATSKTYMVTSLSDANCTAIAADMTGSAAITVNALPVVYAVNGGGSYCSGGAGVIVGLSNSNLNINYQLYRDGISLGGPGLVAGTGAPVSFGSQTVEGTYTVVATNSLSNCVQTMSGNAVVSIDPLPQAAQSITGNGTVCQGTTQVYSVPVIADALTYIWSLPPNASITAGAGSNSVTVSFSSTASTGLLSVYGQNLCGNGSSSSRTITVNSLPAAAGAIVGSVNVCAGYSYNYSVPAISDATGYSWSVPAGSNIVSGSGTNSILVSYSALAVAGSIVVTGTNACGNGVSSSIAIVVNTRPTAVLSINSGANICNGQTANLQLNFTGTAPWNYTYSDGTSSVSGSTSSNPFTFNVSPSVTTTYTLTALSDAKCTAMASDISGSPSVTVFPRPTSIISGSATVCSGSSTPVTVTLSGTGPWNLTYFNGSSVAAVTSSSPYIFNVILNSSKTYTITSLSDANCTALPADMTGSAIIGINSLPTAYAITGGGNFCEGGAGIEIGLSNSSIGVDYQLYLDGVSLGASGMESGTGAAISFGFKTNAGTYTVSAVNTATLCTQNMTGNAIVSVDPLPDPAQPIVGSGAVCQGTSQVYSVPVIAHADTYIWSLPPNASITAGFSTNSITVFYAGNAADGTLSVYGQNSCGIGTAANRVITINFLPSPAGAITGISTVCEGNSYTYTVLPIANATGYLWTVPAGASITGGQGTNSITVGYSDAAVSGNISVMGTSACGSGAASSFAVTVNQRPTVTLSSIGNINICNGQTATLVMGFTGTGPWDYTYSDGFVSTSGTTSSNPFSFTVSPLATRTYTITALNDAGCDATPTDISGSVTVNVKPRPTGFLSGTTALCAGNSATISVTLTGNSPWTFTYTDGTPVVINSITTPYTFSATPLISKTYNLVSLSDANCTALAGDLTGNAVITVNPLPTAYAVTGGGDYCEGGLGQLVGLSNSTSGVNYQLKRDGNPMGVVVSGSGAAISFGLQTNEGEYTVIASNAATSCTKTMTGSVVVRVDPLPAAAQVITGPAAICQGSTQNFSVPAIANATSYIWTLPAGASFVSGIGTNSISVLFSTPGSGNISVAGRNDCGDGTASVKLVTVSSLPGVAAAITGTPNVCKGTNYTYSIAAVSNATGYLWTVPSGVNILSGNGTNSITVEYTATAEAGNITVAGTNVCGTGTASSLAITVNSSPIVNLLTNPSNIICSGQNVLLTAAGGSGYIWSTGSNSPSITETPNTTTIYSVTVTDGNNCSTISSSTITVNPSPTVNAGSDVTRCSGESVTLTATGAASYVWSTGATTSTITLSPVVTTTYTVTGTTTGCSGTDEVVITINPSPLVYSVTGGGSYCQGLPGVLIGLSNSETGVNYQLLRDGFATGNFQSGSSGNVLSFGSQSIIGSYTVSAQNALGCIKMMNGSANVAINQLPDDAQPITGQVSVCPGSSWTYTVPVIANANSYVWQLPLNTTITSGSGTNSITVLFSNTASSGNISVYGQNNCGNGSSATLSIAVNPNLTAPGAIVGPDRVCKGETSVVFSVPVLLNATSYTWSVPSGANIVSGQGTNQVVVDFPNGVNTGNVSVFGTTACVSGIPVSKNVVVVPLPQLSVQAPSGNITCSGIPVTISSSSTTAGVDYLWTAINGGNIVSGENTNVVSVNAAGDYIITVTEPVNSCISASTATVVSAQDIPQNINIVAENAGVISCGTSQIVLTASTTSTFPVSYEWTASAGGNIVSGGGTASPLVNMAGVYQVKVVNLNTNCFALRNFVATAQSDLPEITITDPAGSSISCVSSLVTLNGYAPNATLFWTGPVGAVILDPTSSNPQVNMAGTYTLTATSTITGCSASRVTTVSTDVNLPSVSVNTPGELNCFVGTVILSGGSTTPGANFLWSGPGILSGASTPTPTVNLPGTYSLLVTNPLNGCTNTLSTVVTQNLAQPDVSVDIPDTIDCTQSVVTIEAQSSVSGAGFLWSSLNGTIQGVQNLNTVSVAKAGIYSLTVTDPVNRCTRVVNVDVFENKTAPVVSITPPSLLTCSVTSVVLSANSTIIPSTILWSTLNGNIVSGLTSFSPTVNQTGTYVANVTNSANGCTATASVSVSQDVSPPVISMNINPDVLTCTRNQVMLSGTSSNANLLWTGPSGATIIGNTSQTPMVDMAGVYTLKATLPNGCFSTRNVTVTSNYDKPQNISIQEPGVLSCSTPNVILTASSTTSLATYAWSASDGGNIISLATVNSITVDAAGTYEVVVTHPGTGCKDSISVNVTQNTVAPSFSFPVIPSPITCANPLVTLNVSVQAGNQVLWSGPGNISDATSFSPVVDRAGQYSVTVTNAITGCISTGSITVLEDKTFPDVDIALPQQITCSQPEITLVGNSSISNRTQLWTTTNGSFSSLPPYTNMTVNVNAGGSYTLAVTNTSNGCTSTKTRIVTENKVAPDISIDATVDDKITCSNTQVRLNGFSSSSGAILLWTGPGNIINPSTSSPWVDAQGFYTLTVTGQNGCQAQGQVLVEEDKIYPAAPVVIPPSVLSCTNTTVLLKASPVDPLVDYLWTTTGAGYIFTPTSFQTVVDAAGAYTLKATMRSNGCTASTVTNVVENNVLPLAQISNINPMVTCSNDQVILDGSSSAGINPVWSVLQGGHIVSGAGSFQVLVDAPGTYLLSVTHPVSGCVDTAGILVSSDGSLPALEYNMYPEQLNCLNTQVTLFGKPANAANSFSWSTTNGHFVSNQNSFNPVVDMPGTYILQVRDAVSGCLNYASITVTQNIQTPFLSVQVPAKWTCTNHDIMLRASSSTSNLIYQWTTTGGGVIVPGYSSQQNALVQTPAVYTVKAVNPANGCFSQINVQVLADTIAPDVSVDNTPDLITCSQPQVVLSANSQSSNVEYFWTTSGLGTITNPYSRNPQVNMAGYYRLTVTSQGNGCSKTDSVLVQENRVDPDVIVTPVPNILTCTTQQVSLSASSTVSNIAYLWSGPGIISSATAGIILVNLPGNYSLTVTNPLNGCSNVGSTTVIRDILAPAPPVVDGASNCFGTPTASLQATGTNIRWYSNASLAASFLVNQGSTYTPTAITQLGTHVFYVTQTSLVNGCQSQASTASLVINPNPIPPIPYNQIVCEGQEVPLLQAQGSQIKWYNTSGVYLVSGSAFNTGQTVAGEYTYFASQTNSQACESSKVPVILTIRPTPTPPFLAQDELSVCSGASNPSFEANGSGIKWWADNASQVLLQTGYLYTPLSTLPGEYHFYCTQTDNYGCSSQPSEAVLSIQDVPAQYSLSAGGIICAGSPGFNLSLSGSEVNTNYLLLLDQTVIVATVNGTGSPISFGNQSAQGTYSVRAIGQNGCVTNMTASAGIMVNVLPGTPSSISGPSTVCQGEIIEYSIPVVSNAVDYVWSLPTGMQPVSGTSSNIISVLISSAAISGNITVYATNDCGNGSVSENKPIVVRKLPVAPVGNISGPSTVCESEYDLIYEIPVIGNATSYEWTLLPGMIVTSGQNTNRIVVRFVPNESGGKISVRGKNNCGLGPKSPDFTITVKPLPVSAAGPDQNVCASFTSVQAGTLLTGETGLWSVIYGPASMQTPSTPFSQVNNLRMGSNKFVWTVTYNGCSSNDTLEIKNNRVFVNAGDDQIICSKSSQFMAVEPLSGASWTIVTGSGTISQILSPQSIVSGLLQGTNKFAWLVNQSGCISADTISIINNQPLLPDAGPDQVIAFHQTTLNAKIPEAGTTGHWTLLSGSGVFNDIYDPKTEIVGLAPGPNVIVWTVQRETCILTDTIIIENIMVEPAEAGSNQTLCVDFTTLGATNPTIGTGEWSVISGSAIFENKFVASTKVFNLGNGVNWLRWTVRTTSIYGVATDSVQIVNNQPSQSNAGPNRTICIDSVFLAGNAPMFGTGVWTKISGSGDIMEPFNPLSFVRNLGQGINEFKWTISNTSCISESYVIITNNRPTTAFAGEDQTICFDSTLLLPNTPTIGTGSWNVVSGAGSFIGNIVRQLAPNQNVLRYTITKGTCKSIDEVVIINNKPTTPNAGYDQNICTDTVNLSANQAIQGTGVWNIISGAGQFSDLNVPNPTVTGISNGPNVFRWTITKNECSEFDELIVSNNFVGASAGLDQTLCRDYYQLQAANPLPGIGSWSILSSSGATFDNQSSPNTFVRNLRRGDNQLRWTVRNLECESHDDIIITNNTPSIPFAGENQALCASEAVLQANVPSFGTGAWSVMSGSGTFDNSAEPGTTIRDLGEGNNVVRWTITKEQCVLYDEAIITSNMPVNVFAGNDQNMCSDTAVMFATAPTFGVGHWSIVTGSGFFDNPNNNQTIVRGLGKGANYFKWTVSSSDCHVMDTVIITSNIPTVSIAGADQVICSDSTILGGNTPLVGSGEWIKLSGSATIEDPTMPNSRVYNIAIGSTTLRWVINENGCKSFDEMSITNNQPLPPFAGYDRSVCGDSVRLFAEPPQIGTGNWVLVSGDAVIADPNNNQSRVTNMKFGENTFRWTVRNLNCSLSDDVVITSDYAFVDAGIDRDVNSSIIQLIGNNPAVGTGEWTLSAGQGRILNPDRFDTWVEDLGAGANVFEWTVTNNGCKAKDQIAINYIVMPVADFIPSSLKGCPPLLVNFVNNSIGGAPYKWDFGDGTQSADPNVVHSFNEPGNYRVALTATAPFGWTVVKDTLITVYPLPTAVFDISPKVVYIPGQHISCFNYSIRADSSIWFFGDGNSLAQYAPTYNFADTGWFSVGLKVITEEGCADSMFVQDMVYVKKRSSFFFPEAFSPNPFGSSGGLFDPQDRSNDVFYPIIVDGIISDYEFKVYNRLGVIIFKTNDVKLGWDGYYKGELQPQDVYIYVVTGKFNSGEPFQKIDNVLLLRKDH